MSRQQKYPYSHEELGKDGQPQIEVAYNSSGEIGAIFTYNEAVDAMIMVDLEAFEKRHPSKYHYLQEKVNESLVDVFNRLMEEK